MATKRRRSKPISVPNPILPPSRRGTPWTPMKLNMQVMRVACACIKHLKSLDAAVKSIDDAFSNVDPRFSFEMHDRCNVHLDAMEAILLDAAERVRAHMRPETPRLFVDKVDRELNDDEIPLVPVSDPHRGMRVIKGGQ